MLNVKICGSSAGVSDFGDGSTHQSVEDMAIMRAIPNMTVICPADANETVKAVRAIAEYQGPCYIRLNRNDYPNVTTKDTPFRIGEPQVLREGTDVAVFATGYMLQKAMKAAEALAGEISVKVVNVSTIKPMNRESIAELAKGCKGVVTAEEHSIVGGLGSSIAEALRLERMPIEFVGIMDTFGRSAHSYDDILEYTGLTTERVTEAVRAIYTLQ
jgi:transketolase